MSKRRSLSELGLPTGKKARLHRILHRHGLGNGTAMFLPYDQGLEHGPRDFFSNPAAADPAYIVRLAVEGGFNGVALQVGNAESFFSDVAGEVPLLLKLNGRTELPPSDAPFSPLNASVRDAVRLDADAVGYTLYVGSSRQAEDLAQFWTVREDAQSYGMPIVVFPDPTATAGVMAPYDRTFSTEQAVDAVVASAGRALVVFSGGEKAGDDAVLTWTQQAMDVGATGVIYGRNIWQRDHDESLHFAERLRDVLSRFPSGPAVSP